MRSVKLDGNSVARVIDVPCPSPGPGQVLIRTAISVLCGSELKGYRSNGQERGNSGHEGAGVVTEVGEGVTGLRVGQRVGVSGVVGCGTCDYCARGEHTWCPTWSGCGSMHAEYFVAPTQSCHVLPDDVPWSVGVLISGDGLGVPYHTSRKIAADTVRTVAILGMGPIGLGSALMQSYLGRDVIAVDIVPGRLDLAVSLGAKHTINATDTDVVAAVKELTGGRGSDVAIEAAGQPVTAKQCFTMVRPGGTVVFNGEQGPLELSPSQDFIRRDITAVGSWFYHLCEFPAMLQLYRDGLRVGDLITHQLPVGEAAEAYRAFAAGETGKVALLYTD